MLRLPKEGRSGLQVGSDRAWARVCVQLGITFTGYMPRGFLAKDGYHPEYAERYNAKETTATTYPPRTRLNIEESDGTLAIAYDFLSRGEQLTARLAHQLRKPYLAIEIQGARHGQASIPPDQLQRVRDWLVENDIEILNVAGNASVAIEECVERFLTEVITWESALQDLMDLARAGGFPAVPGNPKGDRLRTLCAMSGIDLWQVGACLQSKGGLG